MDWPQLSRYTAQEFSYLPPQVMAAIAPLHVAFGLVNPETVSQVRAQLASRVKDRGQFSKRQVFYQPVTLILPAAYFYDCADCGFYRQANRSCQVVAGNIEPYAWCGLWLPRSKDQPFSWIGRTLA
jgi:hypothetical protein